MDNVETLEITCQRCHAKIGEYRGPIGYTTPVRSRYFTRVNGTSPAYGDSTEVKCPACGELINELLDVMNAISSRLAQQTAAEVLAEAPIEVIGIDHGTDERSTPETGAEDDSDPRTSEK